jgi:glycosyltransferase involved in cell wall biosynthesis
VTLAVCVPVHDPDGKYHHYLEELVVSVVGQDLIPNELILAANHEIQNLSTLNRLIDGRFALRVVRTSGFNAPSNLNQAIKQCQSDFVKVLFQDDYLATRTSLSSNLSVLKSSGASWCATGFTHYEDNEGVVIRPMVPKFTNSLVRGRNRIGAPSVIMFRRRNWLKVDVRMVFTFDCDWYLRMCHRWGPPVIDSALAVQIRLHEGQATHWARRELHREVELMKEKHSKRGIFFTDVRHNECRCTSPSGYESKVGGQN